jgi:hypothetical protein
MVMYDLNPLGDWGFERLIQALLKKIIGQGVITFGVGPDGGREATYFGSANYPSETNKWSGNWTFQAKFHNTYHNLSGARKLVVRDLSTELDKITNLSRGQCDNYILATNVPLSSVPKRGTHAKIENIQNQFKDKVPNIHVWGYDDVCRFLDNNTDIRHAYRNLITPGDVLSSMMVTPASGALDGEYHRRKRIKRYYIVRMKSDYSLFLSRYNQLIIYMRDYLRERTPLNWNTLERHCDFFVPYVDNFIQAVTNDLSTISHFLDSPRLMDKFNPMITLFAGAIKGDLQNTSWRYFQDSDLLYVIEQMNSSMNNIRQYMEDLDEEIAD